MRNSRIPVRARLAYLIGYLATYMPVGITGVSGRSDMPLKQRDLSHMLDSAEETLSRAMHALEDEGLIHTAPETGAVTIPDTAALEAVFTRYL